MAKIGKWMTLISVVMLVLSVAPIMLYAEFGPADGNPVGLGLLMVFGGSLFGSTLAVGIAIWMVGWLVGCRKRGGHDADGSPPG
jgi:hypothetical protein